MMEKITGVLKRSAVIVIPLATAVALCFAVFLLDRVIDGWVATAVSGDTAVADLSSGEDVTPDDEGNTEEGKDPKAGDGGGKSDDASSSDDGGQVSYQTMVCVPYDKMYLRKEPSGDSTDYIATLDAGDIVECEQKSGSFTPGEYYYVKERSSGDEGYALSDCLVPVYYEDDPDEDGIVETEDALYTYEMMVADIASLCRKYDDILSSEVAAKSKDGRNIYCLYLGDRDAAHHIFVSATIHAREYMNTQLVMKLVEYYCSNIDKGSINGIGYRDLFEDTCICIVPMVNPDGVEIAQFGPDAIKDEDLAAVPLLCYESDAKNLASAIDELGDLFWVDHYKEKGFDIALYDLDPISFEDYTKQWKSNAAGVDLNNNFDANWEELDLKEDISYSGYKGSEPASEPESAALVKLAEEYDHDMYLNYHSKGELIYYDTNGNLPEVSEGSKELADLAADQLKYTPVSNKTAYNVNQGGFGDWVQLKLSKPSITIESGRHRCPLSIREFKPMWLRHRELWAVLMHNMYDGTKTAEKKDDSNKDGSKKTAATKDDSNKDDNKTSEKKDNVKKTDSQKDDEKKEIRLRPDDVSATSVLDARSKDKATYDPYNATDGDIRTAWVEGRSGLGEGETISISFDDTKEITNIVVYGGFMKTKYRYTVNGKPTRIRVDTGNDEIYCDLETYEPGDADVPYDDAQGTVIRFDEPVKSDHIDITIMSAEAGTKYTDTGISEIEVYGFDKE